MGKYPTLAKERIGTVRKNHHRSDMEVVEYITSDDIWVIFERGNKVHTSWTVFNKRDVKNVYDRTVYGVGYLGEGNYKPTLNKKITKQYSAWLNMLQRCYDEQKLKKSPTYRDCSVIEEWHNFQNFAKWFDENYYDFGERMCLDKDILHKGNKVYSPENCIYVPASINTMFVKNDARRGKFPIGVQQSNKTTFIAISNDGKRGKPITIGYSKTPEEAFVIYKEFREKLIKNIADEYKDKIPVKLHNALYTYEIEISD